MAEKTVYIVVRLDISNETTKEITDEDVQGIITKTDYHFGNVGDFKIDTEICGINE